MILNGERLRAATVSGLLTYSLRLVDDRPFGLVAWDFLEPLLENSLVCGYGSPTRVKKYQMLVEMTEADRILGENASRTRRERPILPLDMLRRVASASKTTFREELKVIRNGRAAHVDLIQHKACSKLMLKKEQERHDAELERIRREAA